MSKKYRPSFFRKASLAVWKAPWDPSTYGRFELDLSNFLEWQKRLKDQKGIKISATQFIAKAFGLAFAKYPHCNVEVSSFGSIRKKQQVSATVMTHVPKSDRGADLTLLNIANIDKLSLVDVYNKFNKQLPLTRAKRDSFLKHVYKLARYLPQILIRPIIRFYLFVVYDLRISLKWIGLPKNPFGSFVISNVGSLGLDEGHPPLVGIGRFSLMVGLGKIIDRPVVRDGVIVIAPIMAMNVTLDHRCYDGFQGVQLLNHVREFIANPDQICATSKTTQVNFESTPSTHSLN